MTETKPTPGASVPWAQFTAEVIALTHLMTFVVQLKTSFPTLLDALPTLADKLTPSQDFPQEKIDELRSKAAQLSASLGKGGLPASFEYFWCEIILSRVVDQFELYLTRLVARLLRSYPKALADMQIPMRQLLDCSDLQEVINRSIEEKVHQLSFTGMSGIADFMEKQFGILIDRDAKAYVAVSEIIEVRHLVVHQGALVTRRFVAKTGRADLKQGEPFPMGWQWVHDAVRHLKDLSDDWDRLVLAKLPRDDKASN